VKRALKPLFQRRKTRAARLVEPGRVEARTTDGNALAEIGEAHVGAVLGDRLVDTDPAVAVALTARDLKLAYTGLDEVREQHRTAAGHLSPYDFVVRHDKFARRSASLWLSILWPRLSSMAPGSRPFANRDGDNPIDLGQMETREMTTFLTEILLGLVFILAIIAFLPGAALLLRCIWAIATGTTHGPAKARDSPAKGAR
jgi:hypothetical protein